MLSGNTFVLLPFGFSNPSLSLVLTTFLQIEMSAVRSLLSGFFFRACFCIYTLELNLFPSPAFSFSTYPMPPRRKAATVDSGSPAKISNTTVTGEVKPIRSTRKKSVSLLYPYCSMFFFRY